jgi:hypothetical protein
MKELPHHEEIVHTPSATNSAQAAPGGLPFLADRFAPDSCRISHCYCPAGHIWGDDFAMYVHHAKNLSKAGPTPRPAIYFIPQSR